MGCNPKIQLSPWFLVRGSLQRCTLGTLNKENLNDVPFLRPDTFCGSSFTMLDLPSSEEVVLFVPYITGEDYDPYNLACRLSPDIPGVRLLPIICIDAHSPRFWAGEYASSEPIPHVSSYEDLFHRNETNPPGWMNASVDAILVLRLIVHLPTNDGGPSPCPFYRVCAPLPSPESV